MKQNKIDVAELGERVKVIGLDDIPSRFGYLETIWRKVQLIEEVLDFTSPDKNRTGNPETNHGLKVALGDIEAFNFIKPDAYATEVLHGTATGAMKSVKIAKYGWVSKDVVKETAGRIQKMTGRTLGAVLENELKKENMYLKRCTNELKRIERDFAESVYIDSEKTLKKTKEHYVKWALFRNQPFISAHEISQVAYDLAEYELPEKVDMQENIGYDPRHKWQKRFEALKKFKKQSEEKSLDDIHKEEFGTQKKVLARYAKYRQC